MNYSIDHHKNWILFIIKYLFLFIIIYYYYLLFITVLSFVYLFIYLFIIIINQVLLFIIRWFMTPKTSEKIAPPLTTTPGIVLPLFKHTLALWPRFKEIGRLL